MVSLHRSSNAAPLVSLASAQAGEGAGPYPDPDFRQLDSWIVIHQDNTATFYVGKTDLGQGTGTAFRQIMSDELDMAFDRTTCIMGNTDITVDQGGSGGSDALQTDGYPMRRVAAEARRVLLDMASRASRQPRRPADSHRRRRLARRDPNRRVTYGELIGGRRFSVTLTGNDINATTGIAKIKPVQQMKNVGLSPRRDDIPAKVDASRIWATGAKVPGMVHARNVKPPVAGAEVVSLDESSVSGMPGFVRVVRERNYVAVVCEREEQAIAAARRLKVNWRKPATAPFPASDDLFTYMRQAKPTSSPDPSVNGNIDTALAGAVTRIEAEYEVPFQGHTSIGPAHAMADPSNGQMTIYSNDMKSYGLRSGVAEFLGIPRDRVRVLWMQGPQAYGRTAADDAGFEAAFSRTSSDARARAMVARRRDGVGYEGSRVSRADAGRPRCAGESRGARLRGTRGRLLPPRIQRARHRAHRAAHGTEASDMPPPAEWPRRRDMYSVPNRRTAGHVVSLPLVWETPLQNGQPAGSERAASDLRRRIVHRRARRCGKSRSGRLPDAPLVGRQRRRQRLQARALDRGRQGSSGGIRVAAASVAGRSRIRRNPDRSRLRLRVSQPDRRRQRRGSGSQPSHGPGVGEADSHAPTTAGW